MTEDVKCDFCKDPAKYDAKTTLGPWAMLCQADFDRWAYGLGVGKGQAINPDGTVRFAAGPKG